MQNDIEEFLSERAILDEFLAILYNNAIFIQSYIDRKYGKTNTIAILYKLEVRL